MLEEPNFVVGSRFTNEKGFVTKITNTKIYVSFTSSYDCSIGLSLKNFKKTLIVNEDDMNEILKIREAKKVERRLEIEEWKRKHPINLDNYIELPELSAEGYIFGGWYKDPDFKRKVVRIHKNKFTLPLDLHVKWIPIDERSN